MDIQHVIWDWNGTLLDDVQACVDAINILLERRSLPPVNPERYTEIFGFPVQNYYRTLGVDLDSEDWDSLAREFHDAYASTARNAALRRGALDTLAQIRSDRVPMSVLSASERSILETMLAQRRVSSFFEHVYGLSDLYARSKLHLGRRLLSELSVPPGAILLIGDTTHDFEVARELACRCVLVAGGHQAKARLRQCASEALFDDVGEVASFLRTGSRDSGRVRS